MLRSQEKNDANITRTAKKYRERSDPVDIIVQQLEKYTWMTAAHYYLLNCKVSSRYDQVF